MIHKYVHIDGCFHSYSRPTMEIKEYNNNKIMIFFSVAFNRIQVFSDKNQEQQSQNTSYWPMTINPN